MKTAIVGVGKITDIHASALVNLPESSFTAVCGRGKDKTESYASRYGIKAYTDVSEMVLKEQIDVVIICTPHPNHKEPTIAALEAGANVFVAGSAVYGSRDYKETIVALKENGANGAAKYRS